MDSEMEVTGRESDIQPLPEDESVHQKIQLYTKESRGLTRNIDGTPTPTNSLERESYKYEEVAQSTEIRFITPNDDKIPESLSPADLHTAIDWGRENYRGAINIKGFHFKMDQGWQVNNFKKPHKKSR